MATPFNGVIKLDVRDSTPDWEPFLPKKAPEGAPNVLIVLYDDTGLAAWSPFGGRINMPTLQKLADNGLIYSQWHTTALCSPTRSTLPHRAQPPPERDGLHHRGLDRLSRARARTSRRSAGRWPRSCARTATAPSGWARTTTCRSTTWPRGGTKETWPLHQGWDRFYGFLGGETNNWYPDLVDDNHYIDQPYPPEEGYHLSKDLADQAIQMIRDVKASAPSRPWLMWFCPGANHAPHHAPQEYIDKYKGQFDDGYEAYREWVLPRMIEKGILPEGTELTPMNPMPEGTHSPLDDVRPWDSLSDDEKALFARMAEVYAGFSEYTDAQVGRIVDYLEETGQLENTLIFYCADNGASGEGTPERLGQREQVLQRLARTRWRRTSSTSTTSAARTPTTTTRPAGRWRSRRRSGCSSATATRAASATRWSSTGRRASRPRARCATSTTTRSTSCRRSSSASASSSRRRSTATSRCRCPAQSMRYSFDARGRADAQEAPVLRDARHARHLGGRLEGRHGARADVGPRPLRRGRVAALPHRRRPLRGARPRRAGARSKLKQLIDAWFEEAEKYDVLPLDDRCPHRDPQRPAAAARGRRATRYVYYPDTADVPESVAANTRGRSFRILADVELDEPRTPRA